MMRTMLFSLSIRKNWCFFFIVAQPQSDMYHLTWLKLPCYTRIVCKHDIGTSFIMIEYLIWCVLTIYLYSSKTSYDMHITDLSFTHLTPHMTCTSTQRWHLYNSNLACTSPWRVGTFFDLYPTHTFLTLLWQFHVTYCHSLWLLSKKSEWYKQRKESEISDIARHIWFDFVQLRLLRIENLSHNDLEFGLLMLVSYF